MREHTPLRAPAFNGLYVRGEAENCPSDHAIDLLNVKLSNGQIETRDGINADIAINGVKRVYLYRRAGEVSRLLILAGSGNLYDSTNTLTPILTIAAMTDFSAVTLYNRVYLTPHNGVKGLAGEEVYVYDGTTCRKIAASPPSDTAITAENSTESGKVEAGTRVFAYCYETSSGFISAPNGFVSLVCEGEKKVDISDLENGPSGTIAKHIVATKIIDNFNGDFENQEYYFVPDGTINDNTTTAVTVNFYDADLQESADFLLDQLDEVPAGVGIAVYQDRLIVWGEDAEPNIVRVSYPQEPEAFDEVEGYLSIDPNDGGGTIQNVSILRNTLYIWKQFRGYFTNDNGDNAIYWNVDKLDSVLGAYPHSIGYAFEDNEKVLYDQNFIVNPEGLWLFKGLFSVEALTWKIEDYWARVNKNYFYKVQCVVDSYNNQIYINAPLDDETECSHVFVCNWENGLTPEGVKWSVWTFPYEPTSIFLDINSTDGTSQFKFGSADNNIYKQEADRRNDNSAAAINSYYRFAYAQEQEGENHFTMVRFRAHGNGNLLLTVYSLDDVDSISPTALALSSSTKVTLQRSFNFVSEKASVKISINTTNSWFRINSATLYATLLDQERPEL